MEQYLLLAKGARGRALVDLIQKVTSDPAVFAFGELLDNPSVKEVCSMHKKSLHGAPTPSTPVMFHASALACLHRAFIEQYLFFSALCHCYLMPIRSTCKRSEDFCCVAQLEQSEFASAYQLLQLFAYSTWADYTGAM